MSSPAFLVLRCPAVLPTYLQQTVFCVCDAAIWPLGVSVGCEEPRVNGGQAGAFPFLSYFLLRSSDSDVNWSWGGPGGLDSKGNCCTHRYCRYKIHREVPTEMRDEGSWPAHTPPAPVLHITPPERLSVFHAGGGGGVASVDRNL